MEELACQNTESIDYGGTTVPYNEEKQRHIININEGVVGYQLNIGCQSAYFENVDKATKIVNYYLKNKVECIRAYQQDNLTELVTKILA
jgi:hypothetical protein